MANFFFYSLKQIKHFMFKYNKLNLLHCKVNNASHSYEGMESRAEVGEQIRKLVQYLSYYD